MYDTETPSRIAYPDSWITCLSPGGEHNNCGSTRTMIYQRHNNAEHWGFLRFFA